MIEVHINPRRQPTVLTMGLGSVVVGSVVHDGMPGIYFCPAEKPGVIDGDATAEVAGKDASENAFILRFANMDAVLGHLDRIRSMIADFEAAKARESEDA